MGNPVGWFEIYVQDMARARAFYETTLGRKLEPLPGSGEGAEPEMWAFPMDPQAPGSSGALVRMTGVASGGGGTLVYFSCEDCAVEAGRAAASGGRIIKEKFSIGLYGFIALAVDRDGNMFGLHSIR